MAKTIQQPTAVVRCEWSGNRANAWDTDGNKRTSEITVGARQKAADGGYLLGRFQMKNGKFQWRRGKRLSHPFFGWCRVKPGTNKTI